MVFVTKDEFVELKNKFPNLRSTITSKQKKSNRKKRFVEEMPEILKMLEQLRSV